MGDVFGILDLIEPFRYRIQYLITGVQQEVRVDPDKEDLFSGSDILDKRPLACPFLRERGGREVICTVYQTRPELCRIYLCSRAENAGKHDEPEGS
jgi:Fe-S-cluster containining protein